MKTEPAFADAGNEDVRGARAPRPERPAWRSRRALAILLLVAVGGAAADLWSKHAVFSDLLNRPDLPTRARALRERTSGPLSPRRALQRLGIQQRVAPGVHWTLSTNPGVVFGQTWIPRTGVVIATLATFVLVGFFFATAEARDLSVHVGLGLILGGAVGNLYDRLFSSVKLPGFEPIRYHVRDFIDLSELHYPWIFNIADMLLVAGVGLLVVHWLLLARRTTAANRRTKESGP